MKREKKNLRLIEDRREYEGQKERKSEGNDSGTT
jgi:hypothetical protein